MQVEPVIGQWHAGALDPVLNHRERLPHALLLTGPPGIGKSGCAALLAGALLCLQPDAAGRACGRCQSCRLFAADTHPDLHHVALERQDNDKQAREIKIAQIRALCRSLVQTSQLGGFKVAIIEAADKMNRNAANSLLKTLEEPTEDTVLILVTARPARLLPTVRSRCQALRLRAPGREQALEWLAERFPGENAEALLAAADGAPFAAGELAGEGLLAARGELFGEFRDIARGRAEPGRVAGNWQKHFGERLFGWWQSWLQDLICLEGAAGAGRPANPDLEKDLRALAGRIDLRELFGFYDRVQQASQLVYRSVNPQLLLESLLLDWSRITARCR